MRRGAPRSARTAARRRPKALLSTPAEPAQRAATADVHRLVHELQVHQVELQVQNDELVSARSELEAAVASYAELFDFAPIGYATVTDDGSIRAINREGARLLGAERSRLIGSRFVTFLAGAARRPFDDLVARSLTSATTQCCEVERLGATVSLHCWATALPSPGKLVLLAFQDVTEEKQREEQLRRAHESLREANRRKDEFLAVLSHELRNPLAPIHNSLFLLERAEPGGERAKKAQAILERQVKHLTRLVDDLLDVTRITRGKIKLQRELVELGDLVRKTVEDHRGAFVDNGIALEAHCHAGAFTVNGDPARLVQALSNLLSNAQKFTAPGGAVAVTLYRSGAWAVLAVEDNGAGIEKEVIPHLFEPFVQAPQGLDRPRGGLGLGLATVKGLVELHGGSVAIASDGLGAGTTITMTLPLEPGLPSSHLGNAGEASAGAG